jgi:hypothetical protein
VIARDFSQNPDGECPLCGATGRCYIVPPRFCHCDEPESTTTFHGKPFQPYFDAALNTLITGPKQKERVLKSMDLQEIGTDYKRHIAGTAYSPKPINFGITRDETMSALKQARERNARNRSED